MSGFGKIAFSVGLVGITAFSDLITKSLVRSQIAVGEKISIISNFFDLTHLHNPGAAFGLLRDINPSLRMVFFLSVYALVSYFAASRIRATHSKLEVAALSLLLGGALGNAIDRLSNGFVTDFLDFYIASHHYPAFNLADIAICTAVGMLLANEYLDKRRRVSDEHN